MKMGGGRGGLAWVPSPMGAEMDGPACVLGEALSLLKDVPVRPSCGGVVVAHLGA